MENLKKKFLMKWLLFFAAAFVMSLSLTACGDEEDEPDAGGSVSSAHPLTGSWVGDDYEGTERVYVFGTDGSGYVQRTRGRENFVDYKVEDGRLYLHYESDYNYGDDSYENEGAIRIVDENHFEISFSSGTLSSFGVWYTFTRQ